MTRTALVTGGTRGIGEAIARALSSAGYRVVATYAGNDAAAKAFSDDTGIATYKFDVGDFNACRDGIEKISTEIGPIDVLVNNAGITRDAALHKMAPEQWTDVIRTDLDSVFNVTRNVIEGMRARGFGRIVSISSLNGEKGQFGQTNYSAAKAGMVGFTKALALESAAKGITVNAVAPGYTDTEMVRAVPETILQEKIIPQIPVGRLGDPDDVARTVLFLVSDEAGFITGSTLNVNGGQYMG